jgi:hypothetical protein
VTDRMQEAPKSTGGADRRGGRRGFLATLGAGGLAAAIGVFGRSTPAMAGN